MFKCCVCHGKASRRTSQEEDEEDSSREVDEDSSSSSSSSDSSDDEDEKDDEAEEREIEEELAKKFNNQNQPPVASVAPLIRQSVKEEDEEDDESETETETETETGTGTEASEKVVVEVNGDVRSLREEINEKSALDRDAIKEDVVEILNNAVKIVQEIRRGERERLEKITEVSHEESATGSEGSSVTAVPVEDAAPVEDAVPVEDTAPVEDAVPVVPDEEIEKEVDGESKPELKKLESDETEEDVITVIEEDEGDYEIIEEIKRDGPEKSKTDQIEEMIIEELKNELSEEADNDQELKEIMESAVANGSEEVFLESNEQETTTTLTESSGSPPPAEEEPPPPFCEVEIIDEIKKTEVYKIENNVKEKISTKEEESLELKLTQRVSPCEAEAIMEALNNEEAINGDYAINGDLLNIPPPATPPPEEAADMERLELESGAELDFPTPPPIDFDVAESSQGEEEEEQPAPDEAPPPPMPEVERRAGPPVPPWDEELLQPPELVQQLEDFLPVLNRQDSKAPSSPGSKSLPSPPSSASETGCETEAESKSSSDEQTTKIVPCVGSRKGYIERTIDDGPDDDGDDSVFETVSLAKDPEEIKDIPPRPVPPVPRWLSQEEDEPENGGSNGGTSNGSEGFGGMQEPPATPVARDELALRRHRFFSDLLQAARSTAEHRVSFDPLGPMVHPGCEHDDREEHLEELVNRLESVTKRLEQVSTQAAAVVAPPAGSAVTAASLAPAPAAPVQTQEIAVQTKSPSPERSLSIAEELQSHEETSQSSSSSRESTTTVSGASVVEVKSMSIAGFQDLLAGPLQDYLQLSQKIGGDVAAHCKLVEKAFQIQLQFLQTAASRPAPANQSEQVSLLAPTSKQIQEIQEYREKNRGSSFFNHLSAISESIPALGWVAVAPTPAPYVKEMNDAGQFYTNRVLKDWKEKDKTHVEWCKAWVKTLTDLQQFVRQNHTTGLVWAKTGAMPAGGVPPPPPPCMMPMADPAPAVNDDRSALFAEINQGENITKHLKKVTSDMQTHKNACLRSGPAPFKAPVVSNSSSAKTTLPANAPIDKPPVFNRDGKKWLVEYHKGNKNLVVDNAEMNNVVYMFRCQDSNLVIKGKVNSVVLDSCRKCAVVVDSVVASIEFVNCQSVQMQVLAKVPTISIDKTDGCQMYLNKDTLDVELITSKSSEMNVMVPIGNGDYTEYPVPEQFKTVITQKGLSTTAVDSLG